MKEYLKEKMEILFCQVLGLLIAIGAYLLGRFHGM